jgi:hypothetical protein
MHRNLAADVARVLAALHDEGAWFRHGLSDQRVAEITGFDIDRVVTARRAAQGRGLVERVGRGSDTVTMLTPLGVARARAARPTVPAQK